MKETGGLQNQLRAVRARLGLSQQDLATAAGVARQTIGGIEAELYAPSAAVALRLAKALGCRMEDLFWLDDGDVTLEAAPAQGMPPGAQTRVALARIGGRWVAHSLQGEAAFRQEMVPADGLGVWEAGRETLSVRMLDEPDALANTLVLAGCTPAISLWARSSERWHPGLRVHWTHANSQSALESLARGEVHAAGVHLYDAATDTYNAPFVRRALPDRETVLATLGVWEEGFVAAAGNPKSLRGVEDLARPDVTLVNREVGAGSRLLLDTLLGTAGIDSASVAGYGRTVGSHQDVARVVTSGQADLGVTTSSVAAIYGLDFLPLRAVRYDLALLAETLHLEPFRQLLGTLQRRRVRSQLSVLGGFDTTRSGDVTPVG